MTLRLIREPSVDGATLGSLYLDGARFCETLEDVIRERAGVPVAAWKIPGATAIPAGCYRILLQHSHRFGRILPRLQAVPGFEAILIHAGNRSTETEGCILVGLDRAPAEVRRSQMALQRLMQRLVEVSGDIWIDIENPPGDAVGAA